MASSLLASLSLDEYDIRNKFLLVSEENGCDSSFIIASLLWKGLCYSKSSCEGIKSNICLLSLHNTQEHYENISIKLGFNINSYIKKNSLIILEGFKIINEYFNSKNTTNFLKDLFFLLKENVDKLKKGNNSGNVYIIIDDISNLLSLGFRLELVLLFIKYCRTLLSNDNGLSLIIGTYFNETDLEQSVLFKNLYLTSDFYVSISGLKTGFSSDVSGCINVLKKFVIDKTGFNDSINDLYHFKLYDRQVRIFSPGSIQ